MSNGGGTSIKTIPRITRVYSAAYASFPTSGLKVEDLAFATDRLVLYRWSGAAWVAISLHISSGATGAKPTAADLPNGSLFYDTTLSTLDQVQVGAWVTISSNLGESWLHAEFLEDEILFTEKADVADFQANAATGDLTLPTALNDNNTGTETIAANINEYGEVDFGKAVLIKRYRQYGHSHNNADGTWKIQYWDLVTDAWVDWVTGIATRATNDWSSLITVSVKFTTKIRLIATAIDTHTHSHINQLEVIY